MLHVNLRAYPFPSYCPSPSKLKGFFFSSHVLTREPFSGQHPTKLQTEAKLFLRHVGKGRDAKDANRQQKGRACRKLAESGLSVALENLNTVRLTASEGSCFILHSLRTFLQLTFLFLKKGTRALIRSFSSSYLHLTPFFSCWFCLRYGMRK